MFRTVLNVPLVGEMSVFGEAGIFPQCAENGRFRCDLPEECVTSERRARVLKRSVAPACWETFVEREALSYLVLCVLSTVVEERYKYIRFPKHLFSNWWVLFL